MFPFKKSRFKFVLIFCLLALLTLPGNINALMKEISFEQLTKGADSIIIGQVENLTSHWNDDQTNIYTEVTISVKEILKGSAGKETLHVIIAGGTIADLTQWVEDQPVFELGEKVVVFLIEMKTFEFDHMKLRGKPGLFATDFIGTVYGNYQGKLSLSDDKTGTTGKRFLDDFKHNLNLILKGHSISEKQNFYQTNETTFDQAITSINPNIASAGTNSVVTVTGSGFGTRGTNDHLLFYYATYGGYHNYMTSEIVSWTNNQIQAKIPTGVIDNYPYSSSSGPVALYKDGFFHSHTPFTVTFGYGQVRWPETGPSVTYYGNEGGVSGRLAAIQEAANSWNSAGGNFRLNYVGTTSSTQTGRNFKNEILWQNLPEGILGQATIWYSSGTILEADFAFNMIYDWNTNDTCPPGQYDVQSIATHELGHWLNLMDLYGNMIDYPQDTDKIMYGRMSSGVTKRTLHAYDILGIKWIYGDISPQTGSLRVFITPQGACDAGAQWRRTGTTTWHNSGDTETDLSPDVYTVEFNIVPGWNVFANIDVTVQAGQVSEYTGTFTANFDQYSISLATNIAGGMILGDGTYLHNQTAIISAIPSPGFIFNYWTENWQIVSREATYSFLCVANRNLVANFQKVTVFPQVLMFLLDKDE